MPWHLLPNSRQCFDFPPSSFEIPDGGKYSQSKIESNIYRSNFNIFKINRNIAKKMKLTTAMSFGDESSLENDYFLQVVF